MKDTLLEIFDKLGQSKAVFVGKRNSSGDIEFETQAQYSPHDEDIERDAVSELILDNYTEHFDKHMGRFVKQSACINNATRHMYSAIKKAYINASPLKNPQQSKLWKWMDCDNMSRTLERREGLIALYRYVVGSVSDTRDFRFDGGPDNVHAKNLVAILEKMKEKYERR